MYMYIYTGGAYQPSIRVLERLEPATLRLGLQAAQQRRERVGVRPQGRVPRAAEGLVDLFCLFFVWLCFVVVGGVCVRLI